MEGAEDRVSLRDSIQRITVRHDAQQSEIWFLVVLLRRQALLERTPCSDSIECEHRDDLFLVAIFLWSFYGIGPHMP